MVQNFFGHRYFLFHRLRRSTITCYVARRWVLLHQRKNLYQAASSRNCDRRCRQLVTGPSGSPSIAGRCSAPSRIHACSRERRATWLPSFEPGLCALARTMSDVRCTPSRSLSIHRRPIRCAYGYNSGRATARPDIQTMHEQHLALGVLRSLAPASTSLLGHHICGGNSR